MAQTESERVKAEAIAARESAELRAREAGTLSALLSDKRRLTHMNQSDELYNWKKNTRSMSLTPLRNHNRP